MKREFYMIPTFKMKKPLVGVVGEIYVRSNRFTNQDVVRRIEAAGGEAWLAPLGEWISYLNYMEEWIAKNREGGMIKLATLKVKNHFMAKDEKYWMDRMSPILNDRHEPSMVNTVKAGEEFVPIDFEGEVILTMGRAIEFIKGGASLIVNCAPFGCMPGAITSGALQQVEKKYGVPMANMFYDGEGDINDIIDTYVKNIVSSDPRFGITPEEMQR